MTRDSIRRSAAVVAACALSLVFAGSAHALVGPAGAGEPPTTKGSSNTWWFVYTPVDTGYQVCYTLYKNGVEVKSYPKNYGIGGHPPDGGMCETTKYGLTQQGTESYTEAGLQAGSTYQLCSVSFEKVDGFWVLHHNSYGACSTTTIDNGKPSLTTWVGGEASVTNNPVIPVEMQYADALSHPWSQNRSSSLAKAATIGCLTRADSCAPNEYVDGCSQPQYERLTQTAGAKSNWFRCGYDFTQYEDGLVTFCAVQSDWALIDRPGTWDQYFDQSSNQANVSDVACGTIVLDRAGPSVDAGADRTVKAGELVTFSATAADALSGAGQVEWTFGDNTPGASGASATHTYTQPGTYVARAAASDGAGNGGEDTATITVEPAGTTGGGTGSGGTGSGGTGTGTGSTGGGAIATGSTKGGATVQTVDPAQAKTIIAQAGGGGAATVGVAGLDVSAPKTLRLKKRGAKLPVVLDAEGAGTVALSLLKGAKVVSRGGTTITAAGTFVVRLALPRGLKSGSYSLRVSFTPKGASSATTKKLTLRITAPKGRARARAAAVPHVGPPVGDGLATKRPAKRPRR